MVGRSRWVRTFKGPLQVPELFEDSWGARPGENNVCFGTVNGLEADTAPSPKSASRGPIDIFHSATRFGGNDFEIAEFCLCFGSEHPNDGPRVTKPTGSSESR